MKKKRTNGYGLLIGGMALVVLLALFLPTVIFKVQDRYRLAATEIEEGNSFSLSGINADYEMQLEERMGKLLAMDGSSLKVTPIGNGEKEERELKELVDRLRNQEWLHIANGVAGLLTKVDIEETLSAVQSDKKYIVYGKKYIVYGDDYQDGIALILWYIDMYVGKTDTRIRLLADSETESIYYARISCEGKIREKYKGVTAHIDSIYGIKEELGGYILDFYCKYYEDQKKDLEKVVTNGNTQLYSMRYPLSYGELGTDFIFEIGRDEEGNWDFSVGVELIGSLISEMLQN